jgi:hypothetical protein
MTKALRSFGPFLQANVGTDPQTMRRPLPSKTFPVSSYYLMLYKTSYRNSR